MGLEGEEEREREFSLIIKKHLRGEERERERERGGSSATKSTFSPSSLQGQVLSFLFFLLLLILCGSLTCYRFSLNIFKFFLLFFLCLFFFVSSSLLAFFNLILVVGHNNK